ncbi:PilZ domain-containing protein [Stakelama tenebrarum]|uniref:PilZ domain-containing protein n=1 Tax=Stakelama tenebrarum TaxID=2711215 RepID=A0A6G6Y6D3_9SPHN|nr:PilZ domain-containing protein [Sphingosinithalassobacter tenebrarum]QIG80143.1 PilZ domain-containing protein [Sphingosinithalassobacter tenebrarum]
MPKAMQNLAFSDVRREDRDEVYFRVKGFGPDARDLPLLIVNISPHGMMSRCDAPLDIGDRIRITLPIVGVVTSEVRWSLGGRIGCQFETAIDLASYYELLAIMVRD